MMAYIIENESYISDFEKENIIKILQNGYESDTLDFKEYTYHLDDDVNKKNSKVRYEIIKDCLAFLNVEFYVDKYIILGVQEDKINKKFNVVGVQSNDTSSYENIIQAHIQNFISPSPKISIIKNFYADAYPNKELCIIKIKKENYNRPYLLKQEIENENKNGKFKVYPGASFVRRGSETDHMTQQELVSLCRERENTMFAYFDFDDNQINYNIVNEVVLKLDILLNKIVLDSLSLKEKDLKEKFMNLAKSIVKISEEYEINSTDAYVCETFKIINSGIKDYNSIQQRLDNGINSLIIKVLILVNKLYLLERNTSAFIVKKSSNSIKINIKNDIKTYEEYKEAENELNKVKIIFDHLKFNDGSEYYSNILKIRSIDIEKLKPKEMNFVNFNAEFRVSNKIISNLIEPLYGKGSYYVGLRELLQNAIDACKIKMNSKKNNSEEYIPKVIINLNKNENNTILEVIDNGKGMDEAILRDVYFVVGNSNKSDFEANVVGKFGIGALAGFLLGNKIEVETKSDEDEYLYKFQLLKELIDAKNNKNKKSFNINRTYKKQEKSGTKISIELSSELSNIKDFTMLKNKLQLDDWLINSKVNLEFIYKNSIENKAEGFKSITCNDSTLKWITIENSECLELKVFDISQESNSDKENLINKEIIKNLRAYNQYVLYNDILMKADFNSDKLYNSTRIILQYIPFILMNKTNKIDDGNADEEQDIEIPLDRDLIAIKGEIREKIFYSLYKKAIEDFKNKFNLYDLESVRNFKYENINYFFKLPPILFCDMGFFLSNTAIIKYLIENGYNRLVKITGDQINIEVNKFEKNTIYYFVEQYIHKSDFGDNILDGIDGFSLNLFKKYAVNEYSYRTGIKTKALLKILRRLDDKYSCNFNINDNMSADDIWAKFNQIKTTNNLPNIDLIYMYDRCNLTTNEKKLFSNNVMIEVFNGVTLSSYYMFEPFDNKLFMQAYKDINPNIIFSTDSYNDEVAATIK